MPDLTHDRLRDFADWAVTAARDAVQGDVALAVADAERLAEEVADHVGPSAGEEPRYEQFDSAITGLCSVTQSLITAMHYSHEGNTSGARDMLRGKPEQLQAIAAFLRSYYEDHQGEAELIGGVRQRTVRPEAETGSERTMGSSLERLLERDTGDGFVVFENPETGRFVQFARIYEDGVPMLLLDVPYTQLEDGKDEKLKVLLEESQGDVLQDSSESIVFHLDQDAPLGAHLAHRIMLEVYGLDDAYQLSVEEH